MNMRIIPIYGEGVVCQFASVYDATKRKNKSRLFRPHKKKSAQSILYIPMYPTHMYPRCGSNSSCCCCLYRRRRYMYRRRRYTA